MRDRTLDDTAVDALAVQIRALQRMGPGGRAAMMFELSDNLRSLIEAGVRQRHPHWNDRAVERETVRLWIGDDLYRQACGKGPADRLLKETGEQAERIDGFEE